MITCIDICDNYICTGDKTGNILIWKDDKIHQVLIDLNNKNTILFIKIIELIKNQKLILIFSDMLGDVNIVNINLNKKEKDDNYKVMTIINYKDMPVYNILIFPNKKTEIKKEKKNIIIILATSQNLEIYKYFLDTMEKKQLIKMGYIYGEKGKFQFDITEGFGFPPVADLKNKIGRETAAAARSSISNTIVVSDEDQENSMIAVSYGNVIQLFGFRFSEKSEVMFKVIGYYINEKPVLRIIFIFNSMLALITDNLNIKLINTYDFVPKIYSPSDDNKPTKNCLISYNLFDLNNFGIQGQDISMRIDNITIKKNYIY